MKRMQLKANKYTNMTQEQAEDAALYHIGKLESQPSMPNTREWGERTRLHLEKLADVIRIHKITPEKLFSLISYRLLARGLLPAKKSCDEINRLFLRELVSKHVDKKDVNKYMTQFNDQLGMPGTARHAVKIVGRAMRRAVPVLG